MSKPPELNPTACGDAVCLTVAETVTLARWLVAVEGLQDALAGCPGVAAK